MGDTTTTTSQRYALGALIATSVSALVVNANTSAVSILIPAISEDTGNADRHPAVGGDGLLARRGGRDRHVGVAR